ncbi:MAG TPA: endonuclease/exonuclease/phosphatase family protein [Candidatus Binataceae bacterium]|jgi:endonuclease/exonuclease/phosphatase family metal-dependent hydrolase|nr:endonuclease/exonuclease/phosphatase family protein [Candidatus Binataceae bacterium]
MTGAECTVLTFNIYHNLPEHRHLDRRLELIAQGIAERRPHVAALQELLRASACGDLGARLRDRVNQLCGRDLYRLDYCPADGAGDGEFAFDEGVGMLSRLDADGAPAAYKYRAQVDLSAMVGGQLYRLPDDRVVLHRRFRFDGGARMEVFVTHLTDRPESRDGVVVRSAQARELVQLVASHSHPEATVIVAGDFNDVPESETMAALLGGKGFIDLHGAFGSGCGYTNDRDDLDLTAEHGTHNQRIDYLLMRPGRGRTPEVVEVGLFADRPHRQPDGTWLWPSDHVGVIATLRL